MGALGGGHQDGVAPGQQRVLQLRPHAVEHLKLKAVAPDPMATPKVNGVLYHLLVMGGDRGVATAAQRRLL